MEPPYQPKPTDTSQVPVPEDLLDLSETFARNIHEVWAANRIKQGWKYGCRTSDEKKEHPNLVPYDQLTDDEKLYDRETALETIRVILSLGYRIEMPGRRPATPAADPSALRPLRARLEPGERLSVAQIRRAWDAHPWPESAELPTFYLRLAQQAVEAGENFLAYDIASAGLQDRSLARVTRLQLVRIQALALARSGSPSGALERLSALAGEELDGETLGILARTHKDFWLAAPDREEGARHLQRSRDLYLRAFRVQPANSYVAINAASLCLVSGRTDDAVALARRAAAACEGDGPQSSGASDNRYWSLATRAEAALVAGNFAEAEVLYRRASDAGRGRHADLNSSRRQARFLLQHICGEPNRFDHCFLLPNVLVFTGIVSHPAAFDNVAPDGEAEVRRRFAAALNRLAAGIGLTALASAADILLSEVILEQDGVVHLVLPCNADEFKRRYVGDGSRWTARFERLVEEAASTTVVSHHGIYEHRANFVYAHQILHGLGRLKAKSLQTRLICALLDEGVPEGLDAELVLRFWQERNEQVELISFGSDARDSRTGAAAQAPAAPSAPDEFELKALLFADVVGYTRFTEAEIPLFADHFLRRIARLIADSQRPPRIKNSWGDALYFVFDNVADAGCFALELSEFVKQTPWRAYGLSREIQLRIALHAGPVHHVMDPVFGGETFMGTHVSRTARIEPITEEGQICASSAFAALAASAGIADFYCEYVGQRQLSKGYGSFPVYMVRPTKRS